MNRLLKTLKIRNDNKKTEKVLEGVEVDGRGQCLMQNHFFNKSIVIFTQRLHNVTAMKTLLYNAFHTEQHNVVILKEV